VAATATSENLNGALASSGISVAEVPPCDPRDTERLWCCCSVTMVLLHSALFCTATCQVGSRPGAPLPQRLQGRLAWVGHLTRRKPLF